MIPYDLSSGNRLATLRAGWTGKQLPGANPYTGKRPSRKAGTGRKE